MAEVIVSSVVELLISTVKEQIQHKVKLVRGVDEELLDLAEKLNKVRNVLDDADTKQFKEKTVKDWLRRLEQTSYEMEDVLEEWNYAINIHHKNMESEAESSATPKHKVCSLIPSSCFSFKKLVVRHDIANKVQNLKSRLIEILNEEEVHNFVISQPKNDHGAASWRVQSISLIDTSEVQGRKYDIDILVDKLTVNQGLGYQILSVVGAGGLGKTTLAQLIYNDSRVKQCFDFRVWICVSDPFDVVAIAKGIIKAINEQSPPDTTQLDALLKDLISCISGKRILLVLDDVWTEEYEKWEPLKKALEYCRAGSKILVTTRKEQVAKIIETVDKDIYYPELLSDEDCRLLLMRTALCGRSKDEFEKFEEIGKQIAKKCNGLPLAAKTLGSVLRFKNTIQSWKNVLKSEMWELEKVEVELYPHLLLSYHELSPMLKRCFSVCAFFPKDKRIKVEKLISIWVALGYLGSRVGNAGEDLELKGQECFQDLAMRSLFQDFEKDCSTMQIKSCKMHDIIHDFAQFLRKNSRVEAPGMTKRTCQVSHPFLDPRVLEYRILFLDEWSHLYLCDCLASIRMLKCRSGFMAPGLHGMEKLIHLRSLDIKDVPLSKEDLKVVCKLYFLQTLLLVYCHIIEIPVEIRNLVHLRHLDLTWNRELKELPQSMSSLVELQTLLLRGCSLEEIPSDIGNLVHLRHLDLSMNINLKELPQSMCSLVELQTLLLFSCSLEEVPSDIGNLVHLRHLDLSRNLKLKELPKSMCNLVELHTFIILACENLCRIPKELDNISFIRFLVPFHGGSGKHKFELLRELNSLTGDLQLFIHISSNSRELVEDARKAKLSNKMQLQTLEMRFVCERDVEVWVDVIEALEPNQKLQCLHLIHYKGSRLPDWISSPLNQIREIQLWQCSELLSLPPFGKLQFLETLWIFGTSKLKVLGVEWLGIRGREGEMMEDIQPSSVVAFPKLKELRFWNCNIWSEWEDITAEEEESSAVSVMPCLEELILEYCDALQMLPHRLLRKASSLQLLNVAGSAFLTECYGDKDGSPWRSISKNNSQLRLQTVHDPLEEE